MSTMITAMIWHLVLLNTDQVIDVDINQIVLSADKADKEQKSISVQCEMSVKYYPIRICGKPLFMLSTLPMRPHAHRLNWHITEIKLAVDGTASSGSDEGGSWSIERCNLYRHENDSGTEFIGVASLFSSLPDGFQRWPVSKLRAFLKKSDLRVLVQYAVPASLLASNEAPEALRWIGHGESRAFDRGGELWRRKGFTKSLKSVPIQIDDSLLDAMEERLRRLEDNRMP